MKRIYLFMILVATCGVGQAQKKEPLHFSSINAAGFLKGSSDQSFQVQTINGLAFGKWFAGVGAGYENYFKKSLSVFADLRHNLFPKGNTPFIYGDAGMSLPLGPSEGTEWQRIENRKGLYLEGGLGYRVALKGKMAFNFSAGYSHKELHETRINTVFWDFPPYGTNNYREYDDYTFKRLSVKVALQL